MFRPVTWRPPWWRRRRTSSASAPRTCWRRRRGPVVPRGARPTCCRRRGARRHAGRRTGLRARDRARRPYHLIDAAERPLIWAGAGARDRADEVRALAERLAAPVLTTYGARGVLPPGHRCDVGMPPHVEPAGRLWDEADLVIAFGSDLDGHEHAELAPAAAAARSSRSTSTRTTRRKNYRVDAVVGRARPRPHPAARRRRRRAPARRSAPRPAATLDAARAALPRRDLLRAARRRQRRLRHVHPRLLDRRLPRLPPPAQAAVPDGLGHAGLRVPRRARRVARRAPARPSRSRATAASCSPAASWPRWRRSSSRSRR